MTVLDNGSFHLEKGERFPYICPKCKWPHGQEASPALTCSRCDYTGTLADFSQLTMVVETRDA